MAKRRDQPTSTAETAPLQDQAEYTVVARRYRPQQLSELIGQEHVAQALTNAIQSGRIAHAYLFTGARGVGKTSAARILAKALNCERGPTPQPCDQCEICQGIMAGDDVDVLEIDGASNNKVEEVRELRSNVGFLPTRARYKIYIIDEVHMLSTGAFNALLKTLEEPPPHVKFIFATTEVQKIPITILSRCQRFDFAHVKSQQIYDQLAKIVQREGLKADEESLQIIARRAAGSMRDSQSLLDQLLAFSEGDLTADKVHSLLGTPGETRVQQLADAILNHDTAEALSIVGECARQGLQLGELLDQLIDFWRGMMLIHVAGKTAPDLSGTTTHREKMAELAERVNLDTVLAGIDLLAAAKGKLRGSTHGQILIEVAIVRLSRLDELLAVHQITEWLSSSREGGTPAPTGPARAHAPALEGAKKKPQGVTPHAEATPPTPANTADLPLESLWEQTLETIGPIRANRLRVAGLPAILGPNSLVVRFPSADAAYDYCADDRTAELLQTTLKRLTGQDWTVRMEASKKTEVVQTPKENKHHGGERRRELLQLPLFTHAAEVLGAQLVKIDDGFDPEDQRTLPETDASDFIHDIEEG